MAHYIALFNPLAASGHGEQTAKVLTQRMTEDTFTFRDMTGIGDYAAFLRDLPADGRLLLCGGDGTLNRFINDTASLCLPQGIWYYASGTGNDFLRDLGMQSGDLPICIDPYLRDLPTVTVKGKTYRFLNGVGYGIDGYCCEVGDKLRQQSEKPVNYAGIAIKGLLFHYRPTDAVVTVDGVSHEYHKVWLAPVMNGRFYGGGMMPTPAQDRLNAERTVSVMVMFGSGKLKTLTVFPSIFKGEHIRHSDCVHVFSGHEISVRFDRPTALQIDGETILDVTECSVTGAGKTAGV